MDFFAEEDNLCDQALTQYEMSILPPTQRFAEPVSSEYIAKLAEKAVPQNTRKNMTWATKAFEEWRTARNRLFRARIRQPNALDHLMPTTNLEHMSEFELNFTLSRFISEVMKQNGERYPANSLFQLVTSVQGFLRMNNRPVSLLKNPIFKPIMDALDFQMKESTAEAISKPTQADIVSTDLEESLWRNGILGHSNPNQLLHTLMYSLGLHFALRASDHKALNFEEQLSIRTDNEGRMYLNYEETSSKASLGGIRTRKRPQRSARAYCNFLQRERSPVKIYNLYVDKCPTENRPKNLYLHPLPNAKPSNQIWFARRPLGIHAIEVFLKDLTSQVGETGKFTPHSLRATNATRLYHQGVPEQLIQEQTGHSSLSVRRYKRTSDSQKQEISQRLQNPTPSAPNFNLYGDWDHDSADEFQEEKPHKKIKPSASISRPPTPSTSSSSTHHEMPHHPRYPTLPVIRPMSSSTSIPRYQAPQSSQTSTQMTRTSLPRSSTPNPRPQPLEIELEQPQDPQNNRPWDPSNVEVDIDTEKKKIKIKINF